MATEEIDVLIRILDKKITFVNQILTSLILFHNN